MEEEAARVRDALVGIACDSGNPLQEALERDWMGTSGVPLPPSQSPPPGTVIVWESAFYSKIVAQNLASTSRNTHLAAASVAAREAGTWAWGRGTTFSLGTSPTSELQATMAAASGSDTLWERLAKGYGGRIHPALQERLDEIRGQFRDYGVGEGYSAERLAPENLTRRAHAQLHVEHTLEALKLGATTPITEAMWRRELQRSHHVAMKARERDDRPLSSDWRGLVAQGKWKLVTKAESFFPYPPRQLKPGETPTVAPHLILQALEELDGPVADDDTQVWTALDHLYAHSPNFTDNLTRDVAAAAARGKALILPPADKPHKDLPHDALFVQDTIPKRITMGVIKEVTPEEALAPGNVVSQVKAAAKGDLKLTAGELEAVGTGDYRIIGEAAYQRAAGLVARTRTLQQMPEAPSPGECAEHAWDEALENPKLRFCHSGRKLSEYIDCGSFILPGPLQFLETATRDTVAIALDMTAFYFCICLAAVARYSHYLVFKDKYYNQGRLSMGLSDSAICASLASAFIVYFALRYGCKAVYSYIDDLICLVPHISLAAQHMAALRRACNVVVPGGIAEDKTREAASVQTILGLEYNFKEGTVHVTPIKLFHYAVHAHYCLACLTSPGMEWCVTTPHLEKLVGKLGFLTQTTQLARLHMRGLYAALAQRVPPAGRLKEAITEDLRWWCDAFTRGTLEPMRFFDSEEAPLTMHVVTSAWGPPAPLEAVGPVGGGSVAVQRSDAGDHAGASIHEGKVVHRPWTGEEIGFHSDLKEMTAMMEGVRRHDPGWQGKRVVLILDHSANASNINRGNCDSRRNRALIDELYHRAHDGGYKFVAMWAPREGNHAADALAGESSRAGAEQKCADLGLTLL